MRFILRLHLHIIQNRTRQSTIIQSGNRTITSYAAKKENLISLPQNNFNTVDSPIGQFWDSEQVERSKHSYCDRIFVRFTAKCMSYGNIMSLKRLGPIHNAPMPMRSPYKRNRNTPAVVVMHVAPNTVNS